MVFSVLIVQVYPGRSEGYDEVINDMNDFFKYTNLYQLFQPTYHSGHYILLYKFKLY